MGTQEVQNNPASQTPTLEVNMKCNLLNISTLLHRLPKNLNFSYLQAWVLAHTQASHPHVSQQHLTAGVSDEISVLGRYRQLQAGGVAPVLQLIRQQLHGHLLILFIGLVKEFHCQLAKFSGKLYTRHIQAHRCMTRDSKTLFPNVWKSLAIWLNSEDYICLHTQFTILVKTLHDKHM